MSKRRSRGVPPPSRRRPGGTRPFSGRWSALLIVAGVALAYFAWNRLSRRPEAGVPAPADRMSAEDAHAAGLRFGREGRHLASLPFFRSAVRQAPDSWAARENYSNALVNGAQESRVHLGKDEPATRSSVERAAMIRESFRQSAIADSLAQDVRDRAVVVYQRAQALHTFGLVADAVVEFRKAAALDPASGGIARASRDAEARLRSGGAE